MLTYLFIGMEQCARTGLTVAGGRYCRLAIGTAHDVPSLRNRHGSAAGQAINEVRYPTVQCYSPVGATV